MRKYRGIVSIVLSLIVLITLPLWMKNEYYMNVLVVTFWLGMLASGWNVVSGFVGELSLGHSIFVGVGAYTSTLLFINCKISPWLGIFFAAAIGVITAIIIGVPCFRVRGPYFTLATIAFAEALRIYIENHEIGPFGIPLKGAMGLLLPFLGDNPGFFEFSNKIYYYYIIFLMFLISTAVNYFILRRRLGYYLVAIRSDPDASQSLGINITKYKLIALIISAVITSIGGVFYAQYYRYINPARVFGFDLSLRIALVGLIGGQGTVLGPVLGAFVVVPISEFLALKFGSLPGLHLFIYGVCIMLVILFLPKGLVGIFRGNIRKY